MINTNLANTNFSTGYNYQKAAAQGSQPVSIPSQTWVFNTDPIAYTTVVIPHGIKDIQANGIIPTARIFYESSGFMLPFPMPYGGAGTIDGTPSVGTVLGSQGAGPYTSVLVDAVNLTLRISNRTGSTQNYTIHWRLYYDPVA